MTTRNEYNAFGELSTSGNTSNSIGYTGQRLDAETGLMALGNGERYYSPTLARFIQQDSFTGSLTNGQSLNRFAYGYNNPFGYTDLSGNNPDELNEKGFYKQGYIEQGLDDWRDYETSHSSGNWLVDFYKANQREGAKTAYNIADTLFGGWFKREDRLIRNYNNDKISGGQLAAGHFANNIGSAISAAPQIALAIATGGESAALSGLGATTRLDAAIRWGGAEMGFGTFQMAFDDGFNYALYGDKFSSWEDYGKNAAYRFVGGFVGGYLGFKPGAGESKVTSESLTKVENKTTALTKNTAQTEAKVASSKAIEISQQLSKHGDDFARLERFGTEEIPAIREGLQRRGEIVGMADDAVKLKNPYTIRYSQDNIRQTFKDNTKLSETIARLKNKPAYASEIEPVKLVRFKSLPESVQKTLAKQGADEFSVFSLDNRRLYAARRANSKVSTKWATQEELDEINLTERFSTKNGGKSIDLR